MNFLSTKQRPFSHFILSLSSPSSRFLCFSLYSSSSLHSSRRNDEESRNVRVSVWWDIENCCFPNGINVFKIPQHITSAIRVNGIKGPVQIYAFGDVLCLSRPNQEALSSIGVNLIHVPHGGKNSANGFLLADLMYWVSQNPPPAHVFLISGNRDFAGILHRLRMNNYNILLAAKEGSHTPGALCSAASIMWHWNELAKGENLSGRHFNQPPDGPFNSWYGYYRGALEDPFEVPEQQISSRATNDLSNAEASSDNPQPVPKAVLKQIRQVINSYPHGLSASEFRAEMTRNNVTIDKNFYGYKKFSRFLLSMPHIVKAVPGADGRLFLHPASSKLPDPVANADNTARSMTEDGNGDVQMTKRSKGESQPVTRKVDFEPRLPMSSSDGVKEEKVKKVEETPHKKASDVCREDQIASVKENVIDSQVLKNPLAATEEQDSKGEMSFFRRLWRKWSTNQQVIDGPSNVGAENNKNGKSDVSPGYVTKVLSWFKPRKNESPVNTLTEQSTKEPSSLEDMKHDDASHSMKLEDAPQPMKHELFSNDTFWSVFESFLRTYRASDIVLSCKSREQLARRLKTDGPPNLRSLQEGDLLQLVGILISEKKWIKEFPTKSPRFRLYPPSGKSVTSVQAHNPNGLSSSSLLSSSSPINPDKRPSEKSRSEILADCQKLLDELFGQYPEGFNMSLFKNQFLEKYEYALDHQKLGYPKLVSLLRIMPGVKIESSQVFPDSVAYAPGIGSLGSKGRSSGSDSEMSDSPSKGEDAESPWEELGPVDNLNLCKQEEESKSRINHEYEPSVSDNDEFSDIEEDMPTTDGNAGDRSRSRVNEEDSSLLQILNSWHGTKDESDPEKVQASCPEGLVDCSKDVTGRSRSVAGGSKGEASSADNYAKKPKPTKSYTFVAESNEYKLINDIFGESNKSGESRMQS